MAVSAADVVKRTREQVLDWCMRERAGLAWNKVAVLTPTDPGEIWPCSCFGNIPVTESFNE